MRAAGAFFIIAGIGVVIASIIAIPAAGVAFGIGYAICGVLCAVNGALFWREG